MSIFQCFLVAGGVIAILLVVAVIGAAVAILEALEDEEAKK